jgi:hypothetical protein
MTTLANTTSLYRLKHAALAAAVLTAVCVGLPAAAASTSATPLPADNLVKNASFESSVSGWTSYAGNLSLVSGGLYGTRAVKVSAKATASSYTIDDLPESVLSAQAGAEYEASAHVRGIVGRRLCIVVREWSSSTFVSSAQACVNASASWQLLGPVAYKAKRAGSKVDLYIFQGSAVAGDSFEADGIVLRPAGPPAAVPVVEAPLSTIAPAISGSAVVGSTLFATSGSWSGNPAAFSYQWVRCSGTGGSCAPVSGASSASYDVATADVDATLRVAVTASNTAGSTTATSAATTRVTAPAPAPAPAGIATPPVAPQAYVVPAGAVVVRNAAELASAVAATTPRDIVLENGIYTRTAVLSFGVGHRLWARTLGGATLRFGLVLGGNFGGGGQELHGLLIDVADPALTLQGAAVNTWGPAGQNVGVYDSWLQGNRVLSAGVRAHQTNGLRIQRVVANGFTDWGIFFQTYYPAYLTDAPAVSPVVTDADIASVHRPVRGASDGTAEAGLWAGVGCSCARIKIRDTGWSGVLTAGNVNNGVFEDLDIGDVHGKIPAGPLAGASTGVGIYVEHYTRGTVFRRVHVHAGGGTKPRVGVNTEWADPTYAGTNPLDSFVGAAFDIVLEDSTLDTSHDGVYLSDATRTTVRRVSFVGQKYAGIRDFMSAKSGYSTAQVSNVHKMAAGAVNYTTVHGNNIAGYNG